MLVKRCGACNQLFEVAEAASHVNDTLQKPEGIMRTQPIDLCPACRQAAQVRGQAVPVKEEPQERDDGDEATT